MLSSRCDGRVCPSGVRSPRSSLVACARATSGRINRTATTPPIMRPDEPRLIALPAAEFNPSVLRMIRRQLLFGPRGDSSPSACACSMVSRVQLAALAAVRRYGCRVRAGTWLAGNLGPAAANRGRTGRCTWLGRAGGMSDWIRWRQLRRSLDRGSWLTTSSWLSGASLPRVHSVYWRRTTAEGFGPRHT